VPIRAFLAGWVFDSEAVNAMSLAFVDACDALGLRPTAKDPATGLVAEKVIELAIAGVHDTQALRAMILRQFRENDAQTPERAKSREAQRTTLLSRLAVAEPHISTVERCIACQREIVCQT
jgi:hypothetical protein